ncbi:hypothetical protein F7731_00550 [Cytobacillus depressus]|uniref:DUF3899 domain-containing protein n=1 Tax=Cytobacillus depressus TaxID=1602942 RepID=A0A6L3V907_9BACI|nr:hypothetical protein [Cytobacillus depressus]KAB2338100.1 hypothetical protein F7731_00550 [Cytobacillus depressus]
MKKGFIIFFVTLIIETGLTILFSSLISVRFIELMFFAGVAFSAITIWFSSSGGAITKYHNSQISAETGLIQKREDFKLRPNYVVYASIFFLFIGLILFILLLTHVIPPA